MENVFTKKDPLLDVINQVVLGEKKLTDAELKKREEIAQAIERENPGMDMGKKMAIATAQAKKVAEAYAHDGDNFDYRDSDRGRVGVIHPDKAKHYKVGEHAFFYDHGTGNRVAGKVMKKDSKQIHIKHVGKIKKFKISRTHTPQADFDEEVEQIEEGRYLRYDGHVNGKHYSVHVPEHKSIGDYSDSALHKKIAKENPHLHHHEVKAIVHSGGEEDSHVEVSHGGKTYKHHVYNEQEPDYVHESVEQIDELSKKTLGNYISKAVVDVHNDAKWAGETDDKDASNKAFKRVLGVKSAAARLSKQNVSGGRISNFRREEVELNLDEQLENFWGAYLTCLDEAKDDATQQALLLRAMAKDPSDLMKMKRAIAMGDKALTNPVMRQEILKMLDQMMNLTVTDKALLQKTRSSFMKQKQFKAVDTTTTEEYVLEEVEELDELSKGTLNKYVRAAADGPTGVVHSKDMASRFSNPYVKDFMNNRAEKRIKGINTAMKKLNKLTKEEVEELDELSKDTLGNYIKKAATGMNGMAVHAHMSGSASSSDQREKHFDKAFKRGKGISKAVDKLTKEEVDDKPPFEGGREVKSSKPAAERVKKIAKGMQKKYTKKD